MTFEKQEEDFFRHNMLGLGFLRPLRNFLPRKVAQRLGIQRMTGTGDLVIRVGATVVRSSIGRT
jgi:hypothetical protein